MLAQKKKFEVTRDEFKLAVVIAIMGFAFTTRPYILWLNSLSPFAGLLIYEIILYGALYTMSRMHLSLGHIEIKDWSQTIGLWLIQYAFFVTINLTSQYVQWVIDGSVTAPNIFLQSEDGAAFWLFQQILPFASMDALRILTYVITPFILVMIGGYLVRGKIHL